MAHDKLNESDDGFLEAPAGALVIGQGVNGAESFIERAQTGTVRIVVATVAVSTHGSGVLAAVIEAGGETARAQDGPRAADDSHHHLQAVVSVQAVVKEGERLKFKAYPQVEGARVLRTVVYTTEVGRS